MSIRHNLGEAPEVRDEIAVLFEPFTQKKEPVAFYAAFDVISETLAEIAKM